MGQQQSQEPSKPNFQHNAKLLPHSAPITEHNKVEIEDGLIMCSCGYPCGTEHFFNLHIETHCDSLPPIDGSGWPSKHFETVPYVALTQRGVVSKGNVAHAAFTFITLKDDFKEKEVRSAISVVPQIAKEVGEIDDANEKDGRVSALISISPTLWSLWDPSPPAELVEFKDKVNAGQPSQILFPRRPGKLQLFLLAKSNRVDLCYELTKRVISQFGDNITEYHTTQSFAYMASAPYGGRDLTGFVDGTRNPDHLLRSLVDEVIIFPDDHPNDKDHTGGCYMYAGRFVHNLKKFFALPLDDKNQIIGRDHSVIRPHHGYDHRPENPRLGEAGNDEFKTMSGAPERSHVARAFGSMQRQAYPFHAGNEQGLFFTAFSRFLSEIDTALDRMCGFYAKDKSVDNLFGITTAVENMYFYVPSLSELEKLKFENENCFDDSTEKRLEFVLENESVCKGKDKIEEEIEIIENIENENDDKDIIKVLFEYCTNCGYKTIFLEKKKIIESISKKFKVVSNPTIPRLAAFEITLEDGTVIWSKLNHPDGHNNPPHVFPTNEALVDKFKKIINDENTSVDTSDQGLIYQHGKTRVGVW